MLTSLIRTPPSKTAPTSSKDILDETSLTLFYPDAQRTFHGDPGSKIIYASKVYGDITLRLVDPQGRDERWLFAHHLWNSSVLLAELISDEAVQAIDEKDRQTRGPAVGRADVGPSHGIEGPRAEKKISDTDLRAPGRWSVKGERVLELGAGAWYPALSLHDT